MLMIVLLFALIMLINLINMTLKMLNSLKKQQQKPLPPPTPTEIFNISRDNTPSISHDTFTDGDGSTGEFVGFDGFGDSTIIPNVE